MRTNSYLAKLRENLNKTRARINTLMSSVRLIKFVTVQTKRKLTRLKVTDIRTVFHIIDNRQIHYWKEANTSLQHRIEDNPCSVCVLHIYKCLLALYITVD